MQDDSGDTPTEAEKAARRAKNAANRARREANAAARADRKTKRGNATAAATETPIQAKNRRNPARLRQDSAIRAPNPAPADNRDKSARPPEGFNILLVVQAGRLTYEAALFVESLRRNAPGWQGRLILAEPRAEAAWAGHAPAIPDAARAVFESRGAEITPFTARHFGAAYPHGNKIEALKLLPEGEPFVFFDSDTLVTGPLDRVGFDFARPSASMRREGTWPKPPLYGPGYADIWKSLYDRFGLDFASSLDLSQPDEHWERYLYFNAGWFFGADPAEFRRRFLDWSRAILDDPGDALAVQELFPWLDQITLPLVIHSLGGGRPGPELGGLDSDITCHWRKLPLLYARESDRVVEVLEQAAAPPDIAALLKGWEPALRLILQGHGRGALRPAIDRDRLPRAERPLRQQIKRAGWWLV